MRLPAWTRVCARLQACMYVITRSSSPNSRAEVQDAHYLNQTMPFATYGSHTAQRTLGSRAATKTNTVHYKAYTSWRCKVHTGWPERDPENYHVRVEKKKKKNKWCKLLLLRSFKTHLAYPAQEQHHLVFLNWNFSFATSYNIFDSIFFFQRYTTTVIMNTETFFIALKTQCQSITRATWRDNCNQTHRYVSDTQLYWVAIIV